MRVSFASSVGLCLLAVSPPVLGQSLKIDFDGDANSYCREGVFQTQKGYRSFTAGQIAPNHLQPRIAVVYPDAFGPGEKATVTVTTPRGHGRNLDMGITDHWPCRLLPTPFMTGPMADQENLLRDYYGVRWPGDVMTVRLNLPAGVYHMTTCHHRAWTKHVGAGEVRLKVPGVADRVTQLTMSSGVDTSQVAMIDYVFTLSVRGTVVIKLTQKGRGRFGINGIDITRRMSIELLVALVVSQNLSHGLERSLLAKLEAAIESRDRQRYTATCNQLEAFMLRVLASDEIGDEAAMTMISWAEIIREGFEP